MTIALRAAGTATTDPTAVTAINPAVPAGTAAGDISVLTVIAKPYSTVITTPTGWLQVASATNGTTVSGTDTGSTLAAMYVKFGAAVGAIGNLTLSGADSVSAVIHSYSATGWDYEVATSGGDTTDGADYSATGAAGLSVSGGDWIVGSTAVNTDLGTATAPAIAGMAGATLGTVAVRTNVVQTQGNDTRLIAVDVPVSAGTSTSAPTFTYTNASSTSGTTVWMRLRETGVVPGAAATLVEDFSVSLAQWGWSYGGVSVVGGRGRITVDTAYSGVVTAPLWTLAGSSIFCRLYPPVGGGGTYVNLSFRMEAVSQGTYIDCTFEAAGNTITFNNAVGYADPNAVSITYDPVAHAWVRLREAAGTLYWETSPDSVTWTNRRSTNASTPTWVNSNTGASVQFGTHRDAGTNDYAEIANVNITQATLASVVTAGWVNLAARRRAALP